MTVPFLAIYLLNWEYILHWSLIFFANWKCCLVFMGVGDKGRGFQRFQNPTILWKNGPWECILDYSTFIFYQGMIELQLTARPPYIIRDGFVLVADGTIVEIQCSGFENLTWSSSSGLTIQKTSSTSPGFSIYQTYSLPQRTLSLFITFFSQDYIAFYTCRTDNAPISERTVYISSCKLHGYSSVRTIHDLQHALWKSCSSQNKYKGGINSIGS